MGKEAHTLMARIADGLSAKWGEHYSKTVGWLRTRLSFALLRATVLCLRGSRRTWRPISDFMEDGAAMHLMHCD